MQIRKYKAKEILDLEINYEPLIDRLLYKGDTLLIKAQSKVGKSVFSQQLAFALSSGQAFLDTFPVAQDLKIAYISGEGFIGNWKERFNNMKNMWKLGEDSFYFFECMSIGLHKDIDAKLLMANMASCNVKFDVVIFDPIYSLLHGGNINEQEIITQFTNNVDMIKKHYGAAAIIVHHDSEKVMTDSKGNKHSAHHSTAMGSSFIIAAVTHSYTITRYGGKGGKLMHKAKLGRERGGWAIKELDMFMVVPQEDKDNRLGYTLDYDDTNASYYAIKEYIATNKKISDHKPFETIGVSSATFYRNIKKLIDHGIVETEIDEKGKKLYVFSEKKHV